MRLPQSRGMHLSLPRAAQGTAKQNPFSSLDVCPSEWATGPQTLAYMQMALGKGRADKSQGSVWAGPSELPQEASIGRDHHLLAFQGLSSTESWY